MTVRGDRPRRMTYRARQARALMGAAMPEPLGLWLIQFCSAVKVSVLHRRNLVNRLVTFHTTPLKPEPRQGEQRAKPNLVWLWDLAQ